MSTDADIGLGTTIELHNGDGDPGTFYQIAEAYNLTPPDSQADEIDVTHFQSTAREFILGIDDNGECVFEMNFLPGSISEQKILAAKAAKEERAMKLTYPNGSEWSFMVLIKGYSPAVPVDDRMTCTVSGRVTGPIARAGWQDS